MALTLTNIIADFGAYYLNSGQNMKRLYQLLRRTTESEELFTVIVQDDTVWRAAKSLQTRLVQAYQAAFTPIGNTTFNPISIGMFHLKVDTSVTPHDLEATWLGFLTGEGVKPSEWPFIRWWVEMHVIPQIQEDLELNEIVNGVRVEPTAGTAGAAGAGMDGYLKIQDVQTTAGRITPITMGAIPSDPILLVKYFEDFADQIDKRYWKRGMIVACNETIERRYLRAKEKVYGKNTRGDAKIDNSIENTNLYVKGYAGLVNSNRIWCTPKENAIMLKKRTQNEQQFDMQPFNREVKLLSDFWRGVGFILPELVFRSDL
ncbi:hypothetical protein [Fibrivirga algicola]|uniref:Uncharacterized protein n=1 Tax=Fibrivirga algicola TaxID=2950420 RepID=A0ABX0QMR6_9BACT|nr:hypothetical protein [Fibrivirga algicola]NID13764.1 hypothetical protein [Fibrivirga algicola]